MPRYKREFDFNENIIQIIALNVRKYRKLSGLPIEQLALDIGKSAEFMRKFESTLGSEGLSLKTLYKISVVLDISIDKFFENNF